MLIFDWPPAIWQMLECLMLFYVFVLFCFLVLIVVGFKFHFGGHLSKLIVVATIQEVFITMLEGIDQPLEEAARSNLNFNLSTESFLALNALRQVRFSYYIFHQKPRICSGLFCSCNVTQNTLTNIYLCPKVVQYTKALMEYWFILDRRACSATLVGA